MSAQIFGMLDELSCSPANGCRARPQTRGFAAGGGRGVAGVVLGAGTFGAVLATARGGAQLGYSALKR